MIGGAVLYSAWLIAPVLGSELSPLTSYVSEVGASGQPYARLFRATDLLAGTALVVAAALIWRAAPRATTRAGTAAARGALLGLLVLGAATMCDALMPLSCTPTADAACAARELAGQVPFTHLGHAVSSGIAGFGGVVAVLGWALWRGAEGADGRTPLLRRFDGVRLTLGAGVAFLLATAWTLLAMLEPALYLGLAQRAQILSLTLWLVLVALPPRARPR
ncbi:DUF998 domain-containing protein [Tsukamurella spumae]|uniref:DUF998 domain-containing protein n=1 Tax=Tsukamurella spumae TaxID=44753 RepID=A0A846X246_9ACTN|nr:DUF998 domain-containing protein [Tsukamurella spumae]